MAHDGSVAVPHKPSCFLEGGRKPERHEATGSSTREYRYEPKFRLYVVFSRNGQPAMMATEKVSGHEGDGDPLGAMMVKAGHDGDGAPPGLYDTGYPAVMATVTPWAP